MVLQSVHNWDVLLSVIEARLADARISVAAIEWIFGIETSVRIVYVVPYTVL